MLASFLMCVYTGCMPHTILTHRDRQISRETHKLFWKGNFANRGTFIVWALLRPPALFIYNVLIPIQIAYGLQAIVTQRFDQITHYVTTIVLLALAYCVCWAIGGVAIIKNGAVGGSYVQRAVFTNFLQKDYEFYSSTYLGALGSQAVRLRDAFGEYNQVMVNQIPLELITVVSSVVVIGIHSIALAAVTLTCMAVVLSFTVASSRWRLRYRRKLSEQTSALAGVIGDALGQGTTVKSFAAEDYEQTRLGASIARWQHAQYWSWMSSVPSDIGRMLLAAITVGILLLMTARLYQHHAISIAIVALVQLYVIKLITTTQDIAETLKSYEAVMGGAYQAIKTMLLQPQLTDPAEPKKIPKTANSPISFTDVTFRYSDAANKTFAVKNFTLDIRPGERIGVVGYSGSGKTTLTKLLMRFMDVHDGSIAVQDVDIRSVTQHDLRTHIAYVPQEPLLFHRSIAENIAYGRPGASRKAIEAAAKAAYVDEFAKQLPKGYDTLVGERGVKLSGGQRQRVAIARALLKKAPVLVLDEATSALDSRSEKLIQEALWKLMKGRTALVIAHRLSTIQRMDRIAVMDKGKIVQLGTHAELLQDTTGIYAQLWSHQSGGYMGVTASSKT